jgi:RNA polymerase sigma factor (sigma-70 family)
MLRRRVARARSGLSPREQEVVALKYDQGMKIAEIGELLALSPNTVKVLLLRAMKKMAGELKDLQP